MRKSKHDPIIVDPIAYHAGRATVLDPIEQPSGEVARITMDCGERLSEQSSQPKVGIHHDVPEAALPYRELW